VSYIIKLGNENLSVAGSTTIEQYLSDNRWWYVTPPTASTTSAVFDAATSADGN